MRLLELLKQGRILRKGTDASTQQVQREPLKEPPSPSGFESIDDEQVSNIRSMERQHLIEKAEATQKAITTCTGELANGYAKSVVRQVVGRLEDLTATLTNHGSLPEGASLEALFEAYLQLGNQVSSLVDRGLSNKDASRLEKDLKLVAQAAARLAEAAEKVDASVNRGCECPVRLALAKLNTLKDSPDGGYGRWEHIQGRASKAYLGQLWIPWSGKPDDPTLLSFLARDDISGLRRDGDPWSDGTLQEVEETGQIIGRVYVCEDVHLRGAKDVEERNQLNRNEFQRVSQIRLAGTPLTTGTELRSELFERAGLKRRFYEATQSIAKAFMANRDRLGDRFSDLRSALDAEAYRLGGSLKDRFIETELDDQAALAGIAMQAKSPFNKEAGERYLAAVEAFEEVVTATIAEVEEVARTLEQADPETALPKNAGFVRDDRIEKIAQRNAIPLQVLEGGGEPREELYALMDRIDSRQPFQQEHVKAFSNVDGSKHLVERAVIAAEDEGLVVSGFDLDQLATGVSAALENMYQHEFSRDSDARAFSRVYAHAHGVRIEIMGRGDAELPDKLLAKSWYSSHSPPWEHQAPDEVRGEHSGAGAGIEAMVDAFRKASPDEILFGWRAANEGDPSRTGNVIVFNIPFFKQ